MAKTNEDFGRLLKVIESMGDKQTVKASEMPEYREFLAAFPLSRLKSLSAEDYCVGKGSDTFCRWLERGLEPVLGRYMPGTSRGHIVYFDKSDGSLYKNRHLSDLSDEEAVRYTLQVQSTIASADPGEDIRWIDDDAQVFKRADVKPRVTVGHGRKLRLLAAYHPEDVIPISSSAHVGHFLAALGCPPEEIPEEDAPVARMLKLREYFDMARHAYPALSTRGFMLALYDNELAIAPEKPDKEADRSLDSVDGEDRVAPAYLLTWNPEHFKIGGSGEIDTGTEHRWTCHSKQPKVGDTVYLARLGVEPRGIVVKGTVTEGSHDAPHWKDSTKNARYIKFRVDERRLTAAEGLLPMILLAMAVPDQKWSPQSSGVGIPAATERVLRQLWDTGADKHSLRQVVDWVVSGAGAPGSELKDSFQRYEATTAGAVAVKSSPSQVDEQVLDRLWRMPDNGVAHVGAGTLSNKEFADNLEVLKEFTRKVAANPTAQTLAEIEATWSQLVAAKRLRMLNRAVIRRVFAALSPRQFTTLLREADCQKVLALFSRQFELSPPHSAGTDWVAMNADLVSCMSLAGLDSNPPLENNVAVWRLLDHLSTGDGTAPTKSEEPTLSGSNDHIQEPYAPTPPRNLVLYGPPGTGKTYQTIEEAISILAPEMLEGEPDRASIKTKFDEFVASGRVVFTTFHQSFSYEDFVEGLRAEANDDGQLRYRVADGVFKQLCEGGRSSADTTSAHAWPPFQPGDEINGYQVLRCTADVLELRKPNGKELPLGMKLLSELRSLVRADRISIDDIKQKQVFEKVPETRLEPYLVNGYNNVLPFIVEKMLSVQAGAVDSTTHPVNQSPKVLIIDEINRGNVARIFGELITLIEPSKRAGMPEALSVTLPYSKRRFSVPNNLHIIATMNTADRSLVGLDVALRRRFEFRELEPRPDLLDEVSVEGVSIGGLLRVMNERIELLLDRDHRLGHAYFLCLRDFPTVSELARIFRANVLPLLQEYFFEDFERVRWVLNDHRKPEKLQFLTAPDAGVDRLFGDSANLANRPIRWVVNEHAFHLPEAYAAVLSTTV